MKKKDMNAVIATLGGIVHLGTSEDAIEILHQLQDCTIIDMSITLSHEEYHIHLKSFYKFTLEHDDVLHDIKPNEELFLFIGKCKLC